MERSVKAIASIVSGALIFGMAYGAGTGMLHVLTVCAVGLGVIFGTTFSHKQQIKVVA